MKKLTPAFLRKMADPKRLCQKDVQDLYRLFFAECSKYRDGTEGQKASATELHKLVLQALERFDHWLGRIEDRVWLEEQWGPVLQMIETAFAALEEHLREFPDPEIQRTVEGYRKALEDFEQNQTEPGVIEVPFLS